MKQPLSLLLPLLLLMSSFLYAQSPAVQWQHCYGGPGGDYAFDIQQTVDGGFITAGYTESPGGDVSGYHGNVGIDDFWVIKTDKDGKIEWQKCLGGDYVEFSLGAGIKQTQDGNYILAGTSASVNCDITTNHGGVDFWLVKIDSKGNVIWNKCYGGSQNDYAYSMCIAADGGYIVAGNTLSSDGDVTGYHKDLDGWIIKVSKDGVLEWQKDLGGTNMEEFYGIDATVDGGCIVTGYTFSTDGDVPAIHGERDLWVVRLNNSGNVVWNKVYGGTAHEIGWSIKTTSDGGCVVAGSTGSNNGDVSGNHQSLGVFGDAWVLKIDQQGGLQWQKCYGGTYNEIAFAIDLTKDGGYVVAGFAESADFDVSCNVKYEDGWALKISGTGNIQWTKSLGGNYQDELHSIHELNDGSYIIAGYTCSMDIAGYHPVTIANASCADFWVIKLAAPTAQTNKPVVIIDKSAKICSGRATLSAEAKFAGTKYNYQWLRNGTDVGINTATYTGSDFKDNDQVVCILTAGGNCEDVSTLSASDTIVLHNNSNVVHPQLNITADNTAICNCTPVTFKANASYKGPGALYSWTINDVTNGITDSIFSGKNLKDGDVIRCIYDNNDVCIPEAPVMSNTIQVTTATNATAALSITAFATNICAGSSVMFIAQPVNAGTKPIYTWQINGTSAGNNNDTFYTNNLKDGDIVKCILTPDPLYTCAANNNATSNSIAISVQTQSVPLLAITATDTVICKGSVVLFTANAVNAGQKPSYQWQINNVNAGTNQSTFSTNNLNDNDKVSCIVTVDVTNTCTTLSSINSNTITITINNGVAASIAINASANEICVGKTITFTANATNAGSNPVYLWQVNNSPVSTTDSLFSTNSLRNGDLVSCILSPGAGACASVQVTSNAITAVIIDSPTIVISPADTVIAAGNKLQLKALVAGNVQSFEWIPSYNLENPTSLQPFTLPLTTTTTFVLSVISDHGCQASKTAVVKIFRILNMPGAFTPNGDGRNDIYRIPPEVNITLNEFMIFDRWGNKVFATKNISEGWDGSYKGYKAAAGTYVFVLNGSDIHGEIALKGSFVLIR